MYTSLVRAMAVSGGGHRVSVVAAGPVRWLVCFPRGLPRHSPLAKRCCNYWSLANRLGCSLCTQVARQSPRIAINSFDFSLLYRQFVLRFASVVSHQLSWRRQGCLRSFPFVNGSSRRITTVCSLATVIHHLQYT